MPSLQSERSAAGIDLQARIDAAEQAVMRSDARVKQRLQELSDEVQQFTSPKHLLSLAGGLLLARVLRPRRSSESRDGAEARPGLLGFALRLLLPLASGWLRGRRKKAPLSPAP